MTIEEALQRQGWRLKATQKWVSVEDGREEFKQAFGTERVGKLIGSNFYITLPSVQLAAERLITNLGETVESIVSTSGRGATYPGFSHADISFDVLLAFAEQLRREVDARIQK